MCAARRSDVRIVSFGPRGLGIIEPLALLHEPARRTVPTLHAYCAFAAPTNDHLHPATYGLATSQRPHHRATRVTVKSSNSVIAVRLRPTRRPCRDTGSASVCSSISLPSEIAFELRPLHRDP
jgi:hypothetical protein